MKTGRIQRRAVLADLQVQVRPVEWPSSRRSRWSGRRRRLRPARGRPPRRQMGVEAGQAVHRGRSRRSGRRTGFPLARHRARGDGAHRLARGRGDVDARMEAPPGLPGQLAQAEGGVDGAARQGLGEGDRRRVRGRGLGGPEGGQAGHGLAHAVEQARIGGAGRGEEGGRREDAQEAGAGETSVSRPRKPGIPRRTTPPN